MRQVWYKLDDILFKAVRLVIFVTMTALVLVSTAQVLMRYFLSMPMRWSNEFCCFMLVYDVFLGAALALRTGDHVRLEIEKMPLPGAVRKTFNLLSDVVVYVFLAIFIYYGIRFTSLNGDAVTEVLKWPYYSLYAILPISGILMVVGQTTFLLKKLESK